MSVEHQWVQACLPVFETPNTPEKILANRLTWNGRMVELLQDRRESLLRDLQGVDAQIQSVTSDTRELITAYALSQNPTNNDIKTTPLPSPTAAKGVGDTP